MRPLRGSFRCTVICRYDITSLSPGQVEVLLVDPLRLTDPREIRSILQGYPGLPKAPDSHSASVGLAREDTHEDGTDSHERRASKHSRAGADSREMPELLAALSRAVEEEIRGTRGLFGLETGALERLKHGPRVTPFLRHGTVRQQTSGGAMPHGLAAGGAKKWWRCPRCHISQVCLTSFPRRRRSPLGI